MKTAFNKRRLISVFFLFTFIQFGFAFNDVFLTDVRSLSLGQIYSLGQKLSNPAGISFIENKQIGISSFNRFGLKELSTNSAYGIFPLKSIDFGGKLSSFGYEEYRLTEGRICLSKKLTPLFSLGVSVDYLNENSLLKEENSHDFRGDIGIFWNINSRFDLAFTTRNLLKTMLLYNRVFYTGVNYKPNSACTILVELGTEWEKTPSLSLGFEYLLMNSLIVRSGFQTQSENPAIGAAWLMKGWTLEATFFIHNRLGTSSAIGLSYSF